MFTLIIQVMLLKCKIGWEGNMEKWNGEGLKEPPIPTRMARC